MASSKKAIVKELFAWKKRINDSKKVVRGIVKDVSREFNDVTRDVKKVAASALK